MTTKQWLSCCCLLVITAGASMAAEPEWRMATTPQYRLLSQLSDRQSADWMRGFDQFILSTSNVLKMDLSTLPPLTVVLFKSDRGYKPYKLLLPSGETAKVAGQFVREPTWSMIGMADNMDDAELRRTLQHEAMHWIASMDQSRHPAWFSEGLAEMFSTFERGGNEVNWAKPIESHLELLQRVGTMPLTKFLVEPSPLFERDSRTSQFYAQAWAFTHFLMLARDENRRPLMVKFLEMYKTQSAAATVEAVFGPIMEDTERKFHIYISQRTFSYMTDPVRPAAEPPPLQPAPAALVEASLGALAFGANRKELARRHADKAVELDANAPEGHSVLAYLAMANSDFAQAATHAEAAVKHGSKDSDLFVLLGDSYRDDGAAARQTMVGMYESAINLNPRRLHSYNRLVGVLVNIEKPREEDAKFLDMGLKAFPAEDWLRVGRAVVDYRLGRPAAAMTLMGNALRPESTLDDSQRAYAMRLRRAWVMEKMDSEIRAAADQDDFAGARAVLARYRKDVSTDVGLVTYLDKTDAMLELRELMGRYEQALRTNRKTEARAVAAQLLAKSDLPADLRKYLQRGIGDGK